MPPCAPRTAPTALSPSRTGRCPKPTFCTPASTSSTASTTSSPGGSWRRTTRRCCSAGPASLQSSPPSSRGPRTRRGMLPSTCSVSWSNGRRAMRRTAAASASPFFARRAAPSTRSPPATSPDHAALGLAHAFVHAGLEAPACLFPIFAGEPGTGQALAALPGLLDQEIDRLARHAGGDDHLLHDLLGNLMAVLPSEFRPTFVQHVSGRDEERYGRTALYWLLDRSPEVRLAAASGLSGRVRGHTMEPALPALVPLIRNWMPADSARPLLDTALRETRLRGRFHPMARPAGRPTRFPRRPAGRLGHAASCRHARLCGRTRLRGGGGQGRPRRHDRAHLPGATTRLVPCRTSRTIWGRSTCRSKPSRPRFPPRSRTDLPKGGLHRPV